MKTKISEYTDAFAETPQIIKQRFVDRSWLAMGERQDLTPDEVEQIVINAI